MFDLKSGCLALAAFFVASMYFGEPPIIVAAPVVADATEPERELDCKEIRLYTGTGKKIVEVGADC